jgi:hypothetical protein
MLSTCRIIITILLSSPMIISILSSGWMIKPNVQENVPPDNDTKGKGEYYQPAR